MEVFSVTHIIQSEFEKIKTRKNSVFGQFSLSVSLPPMHIFYKHQKDEVKGFCRGVLKNRIKFWGKCLDNSDLLKETI